MSDHIELTATPPTGTPQVAAHGDARSERFITIRKVLDQEIRPFVQADGGDIELVEVDGNRVKVRLSGACGTCPSSLLTLRMGLQTRLQAHVSPDLVVEELPPASHS